jgi:hypothetical protein
MEREDPPVLSTAASTAVSTSITSKERITLPMVAELMERSKKLNLVWWPGAIISLGISSWGVFLWRGYWPWEPPPGGIEGAFIDAVLSMFVIGGTCAAVVGGLYALSRKMLASHAERLGLEPGLAREVVGRMASARKPPLGKSAEQAMLEHIQSEPRRIQAPPA